MKKFVLALDLKDDPELIARYKKWHCKIWPEIEASIKNAGIQSMEIYLAGNRLFMLMHTDDDFSFARKAEMDAANPKVQEWEALMWTFQQKLPFAKEGEKWVLMEKIFEL